MPMRPIPMIMGAMTMPIEVDDTPTIKELFRNLMDFREEWRLDKSQMVRKDVHTVEHDALIARLARADAEMVRLEASQKEIKLELAARDKERTTLRNQYYFSVVGAALALVVGLVLAVVK